MGAWLKTDMTFCAAQRVPYEVFNLELDPDLTTFDASGINEGTFNEFCGQLLVEDIATREGVGTCLSNARGASTYLSINAQRLRTRLFDGGLRFRKQGFTRGKDQLLTE